MKCSDVCESHVWQIYYRITITIQTYEIEEYVCIFDWPPLSCLVVNPACYTLNVTYCTVVRYPCVSTCLYHQRSGVLNGAAESKYVGHRGGVFDGGRDGEEKVERFLLDYKKEVAQEGAPPRLEVRFVFRRPSQSESLTCSTFFVGQYTPSQSPWGFIIGHIIVALAHFARPLSRQLMLPVGDAYKIAPLLQHGHNNDDSPATPWTPRYSRC